MNQKQAEAEYRETLDRIIKHFDDATATAREVYAAAIAPASRVYHKALADAEKAYRDANKRASAEP